MSGAGCRCQDCWVNYRVDLNVPDELWARIKGTENLLCGVCIMARIESLADKASGFGYLLVQEAEVPS